MTVFELFQVYPSIFHLTKWAISGSDSPSSVVGLILIIVERNLRWMFKRQKLLMSKLFIIKLRKLNNFENSILYYSCGWMGSISSVRSRGCVGVLFYISIYLYICYVIMGVCIVHRCGEWMWNMWKSLNKLIIAFQLIDFFLSFFIVVQFIVNASFILPIILMHKHTQILRYHYINLLFLNKIM